VGVALMRVFPAIAFVLSDLALYRVQVICAAARQRRRVRYSPGVNPATRKNARVKLACDEKPALKAISARGSLPAAISAIAFSRRIGRLLSPSPRSACLARC
jgi:hypothetical protein